MAEDDPLLIARKETATFLMSQELVDEARLWGDLISRVLRGEVEFAEPLPEPRHRCVWCWLVSLLPGHSRCPHGWLEPGCSCWDG